MEEEGGCEAVSIDIRKVWMYYAVGLGLESGVGWHCLMFFDSLRNYLISTSSSHFQHVIIWTQMVINKGVVNGILDLDLSFILLALSLLVEGDLRFCF